MPFDGNNIEHAVFLVTHDIIIKGQVFAERKRQDVKVKMPASERGSKFATQKFNIRSGDNNPCQFKLMHPPDPLLPLRDQVNLIQEDILLAFRRVELKIRLINLIEQPNIEALKTGILKIDHQNVGRRHTVFNKVGHRLTHNIRLPSATRAGNGHDLMVT